ncbi:helix-turn-helix domain-containing protein [Endomicrobium proavitum]|uniref:Transcriptional regulator, XRE family n=1 Tax=Endomicrobium proavitum TaxID=1408281 RepID=A0A0G3WL82_9BACT|nr:XRE family transcriptional regulator [Endomicrobium proavitum]AKL98645.1 Transcriptional regulator, XRE family [Endomicrobium proavitum]
MSQELKQIGVRIKTMREISGLSPADFAKSIGLDEQTYFKYEEGKADIPVSVLSAISSKYNVEVTSLLTGGEPRLSRINVVRKGKGLSIERRKEYKYQDLAFNFQHKKAEVFLVTAEPKNIEPTHAYAHLGQEFNYIIEGTLKLIFDGKEYVLEEGDSVYFDATRKHTMAAVGDKPAKFIAVVL